MMAKFAMTLFLASCLATIGCTSSGSVPAVSGFDPEAGAADAKGAGSSLEEMRQLMGKASEFMDAYKLTEAIKAYVAVLAVAEGDGSPEAAGYASEARIALTEIGATLTIEPSPDWMDAKGNQMTGVTRDAGKPGALTPGVYLYQNMGSSKSPLPDAPVFFEFAENTGSLNVVVATDAFGKATSTVSGIGDPAAEAVIRAYPVFTVRGYRYEFRSVQREFTFLPPTNRIVVAALETSEFGAKDSAESIDAVAMNLETIGFEPSAFNAKLDTSLFLKAYGGDSASLAELGGKTNPSYYAFVFVECYSIKQPSIEGTTRNIFFAYSRATIRIVRSDGSIVFSTSFEIEKVAGYDAKEAAAKSFAQARSMIGDRMKTMLPEIKAALAK